MRHLGRGDRGFTLIEVMVAILIIAISMVALLGRQARNIQTIARVQGIATATLLARGRISEIQSKALVSGLASLSNKSCSKSPEYPRLCDSYTIVPTDLDEMREVKVEVGVGGTDCCATQPVCEIWYFIRDSAL